MDICNLTGVKHSVLILSSIFDSQTMLHENLKFYLVCIPWNQGQLFDVFEKIRNAENSDLQELNEFEKQGVVGQRISASECVRGIAAWVCHFPQSKILNEFMKDTNIFNNPSIERKALKIVKVITRQQSFVYKFNKEMNTNDNIDCEMAILRFIENF